MTSPEAIPFSISARMAVRSCSFGTVIRRESEGSRVSDHTSVRGLGPKVSPVYARIAVTRSAGTSTTVTGITMSFPSVGLLLWSSTMTTWVMPTL